MSQESSDSRNRRDVTFQQKKPSSENDDSSNVTHRCRECVQRGDEHFGQYKLYLSLFCYRQALEAAENAEDTNDYSVPVATIFNKIGRVQLARGEFADATQSHERALSIYKESGLDKDHPDILYTLRSISHVGKTISSMESATALERVGRSKELSGDYHRAMDAYTDALTMKRATLGDFSPFVALTLNKIGVLNWKKGLYDEANKTLRKALRIFEMTLGEQHLECSDTLSNIGNVHLAKGEYDDAMKFHHMSLNVRREALGSDQDHPDLARNLIQIGMVFNERGNHRKAMKLYREGLRIQQKTLTHDHVDVAKTLNCIGVVYEKRGQFDMAMKAYKQASSIYRSSLGEDHIDVAVTLNNMGQIYCHLGKSEKAMRVYERALKVMKESLGGNHRNCAATLHSIARVHSMKDENGESLELYKEALNIQRNALGDFHADVAITLYNMGGVYERTGDIALAGDPSKIGKYKKARRCYMKALRVCRTAYGENHAHVALFLHKIGHFHQEKEKDYLEALRRYTEALKIHKANQLRRDHPYVKETLEKIASIESKLAICSSDDSDSMEFSS